MILKWGYRLGKTVPLHLRVGLFCRGEVPHAAGRLTEGEADFKSALRSPLPSGARECDLFLIQDGWYLEYLLSIAAYDRVRSYVSDHVNAYEGTSLRESIASISLLRTRIHELETPEEVEYEASVVEIIAESLDLRTRPHLIHSLLELAARARQLGSFGLAETLVEKARDACRNANIRLLKIDCLIEDGWNKLGWGRLQAATQAQIGAKAAVERLGYRLRMEEVLRLEAAIDREAR